MKEDLSSSQAEADVLRGEVGIFQQRAMEAELTVGVWHHNSREELATLLQDEDRKTQAALSRVDELEAELASATKELDALREAMTQEMTLRDTAETEQREVEWSKTLESSKLQTQMQAVERDTAAKRRALESELLSVARDASVVILSQAAHRIARQRWRCAVRSWSRGALKGHETLLRQQGALRFVLHARAAQAARDVSRHLRSWRDAKDQAREEELHATWASTLESHHAQAIQSRLTRLRDSLPNRTIAAERAAVQGWRSQARQAIQRNFRVRTQGATRAACRLQKACVVHQWRLGWLMPAHVADAKALVSARAALADALERCTRWEGEASRSLTETVRAEQANAALVSVQQTAMERARTAEGDLARLRGDLCESGPRIASLELMGAQKQLQLEANARRLEELAMSIEAMREALAGHASRLGGLAESHAAQTEASVARGRQVAGLQGHIGHVVASVQARHGTLEVDMASSPM